MAPTAAECNQLVALLNAGHFTGLEIRARSLVGQYPDSGFAWNMLGASLQMQGKDGLHALQNATKFLPNDAEVHSNLGNALSDLGRLSEAEAIYRRALQLNPHSANAHINLGITLRDLGRLDEAEASFRRALQIKPNIAEAHVNLGNTLLDLGRPDDAVASYRRALQLKPAIAGVHNSLGSALRNIGQLDDAVASCRRALEIKPDYVDALINLASILSEKYQFSEAETCLRRVLEIKPNYAEVLNDLGVILESQNRLIEAEDSLRRALEIKPDFAEAHGNMGNVLRGLGQLDDAAASYRRALEIKPNFTQALSSLLFLYAYSASTSPLEYLAMARGWERVYLTSQDRQAARHRGFQRPPLAGRRLRVGYVSGDYRQHAVSYFVEQLFSHHDRARIELFAYATNIQRDAVTERLQVLAEHWVPLAGITDTSIRDRIEADGIDVLIDLSGHSAQNRLEVFACRVAPVQAHYLGFMASTGLTEMDYWIGDEILTPADTDSHFSEQVWCLPRVWVCYDGKADTPAQNWQPNQDGTVWLGSFNSLGKLTPATLTLWAKVLHALPEGKLLLKAKELGDIGNRQRILDVMASHGILSDRIELQDKGATPDWSAHMAYYDRLDIALDPVGGVSGGTTTCDALWMGVPVITLEGDRMASRMTASMLNAINHPEWTSHSEAEYIDKVVALARDVEQRKALRASQRERMASSPLCDAHDLAMCLENAYFRMFELWLAKKTDIGKPIRSAGL